MYLLLFDEACMCNIIIVMLCVYQTSAGMKSFLNSSNNILIFSVVVYATKASCLNA